MINKLQRKFGKYAIPNLMKYVVALYVLGFFVYTIGATRGVNIYSEYFSFNVDAILKGQVWRVVTFLIQPLDGNFLFMLISVYLYYMIGTNLERVWGTFRFNLFYISGVIFNILAAVIIYIIFFVISGGAVHLNYPISLEYINLSMFLAFATIFSEVQLLLFFIIPIKIKYLSWAYVAIEIYNLIQSYIQAGLLIGVCNTIILVVSLANFLIFFVGARRGAGKTFANRKRQSDFRKQFTAGMNGSNVTRNGSVEGTPQRKVITRHKCAVCGRTELDDPDLEFRFCSKCDGNYEYCMTHLYTHSHVIRQYLNPDDEKNSI